MTDCPNGEIRDLLPEFVHGTLTGADRARVESHVAGCVDCASEVTLLRTARRALATAAATVDVASIVRALPAPPEVASTPGVVPIGSARSARSGGPRFGGWRRAAAVGLAAAGLTTIAIVGGRLSGDHRSAAPNVAVTPSVGAGTAGPTSSIGAPTVVATGRGGATATRTASTREAGLSLSGGESDLSDDALATLVGDLDNLDAAPSTEPAPLIPDMTGEGNQ